MRGKLFQAQPGSWVRVQASLQNKYSRHGLLWNFSEVKCFRCPTSTDHKTAVLTLGILDTYLYQILEGRGEGGVVGPVRQTLQDLLVLLEGDVAHHQVVQEDPKAPHGEAAR